MADIGSFNPNNFEPLSNFTAIPKGEWNAAIVDSKMEGTDASNMRVILTFEILEGAAKGEKTDVHLSLWSPEKKGDISRRKLTSICNAVSIMQEFKDTTVLHGRPLTLKTDIRFVPKNNGAPGFSAFADVKAFLPCVGQGRAAGADPVQPTEPQAAPSAAAPQLPTAPAFGSAPANYAPPAAQVPPAASAMMPQGFAPPMAPAPGFAPPAAPGFAPPAAPGGPGPWAAPFPGAR